MWKILPIISTKAISTSFLDAETLPSQRLKMAAARFPATLAVKAWTRDLILVTWKGLLGKPHG